jgi:nucleoside-diphosphate-sugar epimerase
MRVFVTGATGFIGMAVVEDLIKAGHQVLGMARSDEGAKALSAAGAEVHRGSLEDVDSMRSGASKSDGVIHLAFNHDFSKYADNCETDRRVIEAMGVVLADSNRPLIVTSGTAVLTPGRAGTEDDPCATMVPRAASELAAEAMASRGVRASVVRLAPSVHDRKKMGLISPLIDIARGKRVSAYVGEGRNRWSAVHRFDAAHLYTLVLEKGSAGARYHGVAEEGVALRDIATAIGRGLNVPVVSISPEEAAGHFGWLGMFMGADVPTSSAKTQQRLGWHPTQVGLLSDLEKAHAFQN